MTSRLKIILAVSILMLAALLGTSYWFFIGKHNTGTAFAIATNKNSFIAVGKNHKNISEASKSALEICQENAIKKGIENHCTLVAQQDGPAYIAIFFGKTGGYGWAANQDRQAAIDDAYIECKKYDECPTQATAVYESLGTEKVSKVDTSATEKKQSTQSFSRQKNVLRCANDCYNGNCLRTFEDGRKERWQAPRVYNPATQNWEWDTTTNACGS